MLHLSLLLGRSETLVKMARTSLGCNTSTLRCSYHNIIVYLLGGIDSDSIAALFDQPLVFTFGQANYRAVRYDLLRRASLSIEMVI